MQIMARERVFCEKKVGYCLGDDIKVYTSILCQQRRENLREAIVAETELLIQTKQNVKKGDLKARHQRQEARCIHMWSQLHSKASFDVCGKKILTRQLLLLIMLYTQKPTSLIFASFSRHLSDARRQWSSFTGRPCTYTHTQIYWRSSSNAIRQGKIETKSKRRVIEIERKMKKVKKQIEHGEGIKIGKISGI